MTKTFKEEAIALKECYRSLEELNKLSPSERRDELIQEINDYLHTRRGLHSPVELKVSDLDPEARTQFLRTIFYAVKPLIDNPKPRSEFILFPEFEQLVKSKWTGG